MADTQKKDNMKFKETILGVFLLTFMLYGFCVSSNYIWHNEFTFNIFSFKNRNLYLTLIAIAAIIFVAREFRSGRGK